MLAEFKGVALLHSAEAAKQAAVRHEKKRKKLLESALILIASSHSSGTAVGNALALIHDAGNYSGYN